MPLPTWFCTFMIGSVLGIVAHEAGHWAVGRLLGFEVALVTIGTGPIWHRAHVGGTTIELRRCPNAGSVQHVPGAQSRLASVLLGLGGVGGNIALIALIALATSGPSVPLITTVVSGIVWAQVAQIGYNLFPHRFRDGAESDGYQILRALFGKGKAAYDREAAFAASVEPYRTDEDSPHVAASTRLMRACARFEAGADRAAAARRLLRELERGRARRADSLMVIDKLVTRHLLRGDIDLAGRLDELSRRAFDLAPQIATLRGTRGASLVELGRYAEGKALLAPLAAGEDSFDSILSRLFLARAEHGLGDEAAARRLVEGARAALRVHPYPEASRLLDRVASEIAMPPSRSRSFRSAVRVAEAGLPFGCK